MENLRTKVMGKGQKERAVPMSLELRKVLWEYVQTHAFELLFCNSYGGLLVYNNVGRGFQNFMRTWRNCRTGYQSYPEGGSYVTALQTQASEAVEASEAVN